MQQQSRLHQFVLEMICALIYFSCGNLYSNIKKKRREKLFPILYPVLDTKVNLVGDFCSELWIKYHFLILFITKESNFHEATWIICRLYRLKIKTTHISKLFKIFYLQHPF